MDIHKQLRISRRLTDQKGCLDGSSPQQEKIEAKEDKRDTNEGNLQCVRE